MARKRNYRSGSSNIWPGFVDALATMLLSMIFVLVVFVISQVLLTQAISGKEEALTRLNKEVAELVALLDFERRANSDLRLDVAQLSGSLQSSMAERDELTLLLEGSQVKARALDLELDEERRRVGALGQSLDTARDQAASKDEEIRRHLLELSSLKDDIIALRKLREEMERKIGALADKLSVTAAKLSTADARLSSTAAKLNAADAKLSTTAAKLSASLAEASALRDRSKRLETRLSDAAERTRLAQTKIASRDIRLSEFAARHALLKSKYDETLNLTDKQRAHIELLSRQIQALREDIQKLSAILDISEEREREQKSVIKDLGKRLNRALASKVAELARYRSEFFGRLRTLLGARKDIHIVGDRFVFQSELLFSSGAAELGNPGKQQMRRLAATLIEIATRIPADIDWVLRVDGHTDDVPIKTPLFPSNWELASARAISVVKFLIAEGVPPNRLAATGFGKFQPLDKRKNDTARRRNRRIELKFTQR